MYVVPSTPPPRLANNRCGAYFFLIQDCYQVTVKKVSIEFLFRADRATECSMVKNNYFVILSEVRNLLPPARRIAAAAMGKYDCRTIAMHFLIYTSPIRLDRWHACLLIRFKIKKDK